MLFFTWYSSLRKLVRLDLLILPIHVIATQYYKYFYTRQILQNFTLATRSKTKSTKTTTEIPKAISSTILGDHYNGETQQASLHFHEQLLRALAEDVNQVNFPEDFFNIYLIDVSTAANDYAAKKRRNMSSSVNDMFCAVQITVLSCSCSLNQTIFEDKISLNINVTFDASNIDLLGCLARHFQTWTSNVKCHSCSKPQLPARIYFWRLPPILIIHLGRWKDGEKNERFVDFPLENLDISPYLHPNSQVNGMGLYSLYGILQHHIVDAENGHFTAKVKNIQANDWMLCNDTVVSEINAADVKVKIQLN
ncbi:unnamed protein product [Meloidogyne enterolobii]|uniref:Uncharacterized protein n=1 Tax=Meloidogyne enterolobii TaxID=390850 RepID=A0ACB0XWN7_MELEN